LELRKATPNCYHNICRATACNTRYGQDYTKVNGITLRTICHTHKQNEVRIADSWNQFVLSVLHHLPVHEVFRLLLKLATKYSHDTSKRTLDVLALSVIETAKVFI
jgi:hypothetical protein